MIKLPERICIANLPTRIEKLERFSKKLEGPDIYIKRDDNTGMEVSGNKIRKLEFSVKEAIDKGCNCLITCGGVQSNHCRATAAVAAKLGMKCCLILNGNETKPDGNLFLDRLLGADVYFTLPQEYGQNGIEKMQQVKELMKKRGFIPYIIPEGASNGIGVFGYFMAMKEIIQQEKEMNIHFDRIVIAVGSGGTYSGLLLAKKIFNHKTDIYGVNVRANAEYFIGRIEEILHESVNYLDSSLNLHFHKEEIHIIDGYVGKGYALSRPEEIQFIQDFAQLEGIILDPVYTGKAMYGLAQEIKNGFFEDSRNLLFIHTGGLFDIFAQKEMFSFG